MRSPVRSAPKPISTAKRFRHRAEVALVTSSGWIIRRFPRSVVVRLGRGLGWIAFHLLRRERAIALANLDVAYGATKSPHEKQAIACASMQNFAATILGLFWAPRLTATNFTRYVETDQASLDRVRAINASGRGIMFITGHYGDWEIMSLATGFNGVPITVVQEAMQNAAFENIFVRLRGVSGHRVVPGRFAAPTLLKTLKRGGNIAVLIDLNATRKRGGIWLDFFGLPVYSIAAVGALALRSGAAIVPGFAHPLPHGRTRVIYGEEIPVRATADYEGDVKRISQAALAVCEQVIRHDPRHWMWSYKRWSPRATPAQGKYPPYSRYFEDIAPR